MTFFVVAEVSKFFLAKRNSRKFRVIFSFWHLTIKVIASFAFLSLWTAFSLYLFQTIDKINSFLGSRILAKICVLETDRQLKVRPGEHTGISPLTFKKTKPSKKSAILKHLLNCSNIPSLFRSLPFCQTETINSCLKSKKVWL